MPDTTSSLSAKDTVRGLLAATDSGDAAATIPYLSEDLVLYFANEEPIRGLADFLATAKEYNASLASYRHEILDLWEIPDDEAVVTRMLVHYKRLDGRELTLPCCDVFRVRDGKVHEYRIFMDNTPVFAA